MKKMIRNLPLAIVLGTILATASAHAQTTSETTTTTSEGTVSNFSPNMITVQGTTSAAPVNYSYSKTTTYVDENGNPVSMDVVRSGAPVTVYYTSDGGQMVASKVVVRKSTMGDPAVIDKKTTTTTTTSGPAQ